MSSCIVDNITIDRIISGLIQSNVHHKLINECIMDNSAFGQKLLDMNVNAMDQRYEETNEKETYKFNKVVVSKIQAFKSLRCLMYQSMEGNVPETELYQHMEDLGNILAASIVFDLPSYDKAEWE